MTDATVAAGDSGKKSSKMPLILGLVLALAGGGGGYFATSQGFILAPESEVTKESKVDEKPASASDYGSISFIPMDPLTISMPRSSRYDHLRFRGELEVAKEYSSEVQKIMPRIVDVLNSYLRALEISDIEQAASLSRLRSQMLRRVQVVAGPGRVNDLLIMEFVLN